MHKRKVLLLEPNYQNKYPPMGLMKLATYFRERGVDVRFFKGNLNDFAAQLLCEEFFAEVQNIPLAKYEKNIFQFIKTGKFAHLDTVPDFIFSQNDIVLRKYRQHYTAKSFAKFDVVCVTTLFTFYWKETIETINSAKQFIKPKGKIFIGGIAASLLPEKIYKATGIQPICGQLNKKRMIDEDSDVVIDNLPLDYSILEEIDYKYPAADSYFAYMTRGCPNRCAFCAVPKLEPNYCGYIPLKQQLEKVAKLYGERRDLLLLDNNVFASKQFNRIVNEIKDCGFHCGATYTPPNEYAVAIEHLRAKKKENRNVRVYIKMMLAIYDRIAEKLSDEEQTNFYLERERRNLLYPIYADVKAILDFDKEYKRTHKIGLSELYEKLFKRIARVRYIDFNQGVDARLVTDEKMQKLAELNIRPLRIAFDRYSMKSKYIQAIKLAAKYGIKNLSNYLLYNFEDKPGELYERMKLNVELCEKLGVTIYSFPMKYHPIDSPEYFHNRDYIGTHWNRKFIRAIQAVLNSTKGKIGRGKTFFEEAFGRDADEFRKILWMPEAFIIYRRKYDQELRERLAGRYNEHCKSESNLANEWWEKFNSLNDEQANVLKEIVAKNRFSDNDFNTNDSAVLDILEYYKVKRE